MTESGSKIWFEKIKTDAVYNLLTEKYNKIAILPIFDLIIEELKKNELLNIKSIYNLFISMHSNNDVSHIIRLPFIYLIILSSKKNISLEESILNFKLKNKKKIDLGKYVVDKVRKKYPFWKSQFKKVPGESYNSINYPNEFLPYIKKIIEKWYDKQDF